MPSIGDEKLRNFFLHYFWYRYYVCQYVIVEVGWIIFFLYSVDVLINNAGISNANHPLDPPQDCPFYNQQF